MGGFRFPVHGLFSFPLSVLTPEGRESYSRVQSPKLAANHHKAAASQVHQAICANSPMKNPGAVLPSQCAINRKALAEPV